MLIASGYLVAGLTLQVVRVRAPPLGFASCLSTCLLADESLRVAIAGATSLRGKDLKEWMEESGFPAGEIRLLDEELAAGTLTEVGG